MYTYSPNIDGLEYYPDFRSGLNYVTSALNIPSSKIGYDMLAAQVQETSSMINFSVNATNN